MTLEVTVGPPISIVNHGYTFLVSEFDGSITNATDQGFYSRDTRYISHYQLYIDGKPWILLNSGAIAYYASRTYLVNPRVVTAHGDKIDLKVLKDAVAKEQQAGKKGAFAKVTYENKIASKITVGIAPTTPAK